MKLKKITMTVLAVAALTAVGSGTALADTATNVTGDGYPYPVLKQGTKSENVRALQWLLNCHGYPVAVPSHFGPATGHQVRAYQVKFGLMPFDGNVGAYTWTSILSRSQVRYGDRNDCVKAFQVVLNKFRHIDHVADLPITGYFGPATRAAYRAFLHNPGEPGQVATPHAWHLLVESLPNA
jgi:peptidoglycan hydrolase-like protein with peptidoglycan-binding domain